MPDIVISDLPAKASLLDSDLVVLDDGAQSYRVTGAQLRNFITAPLSEVVSALQTAVQNLTAIKADASAAYMRAFTPLNTSIASGDAGIAGTYTISSLPNDGKIRLALFQGFLVTSGIGNSTMSLQTDVMDSSCLIASANNQHSGGGGLLLPIKQQVTIGFPAIGAGVISPTNIICLGYF